MFDSTDVCIDSIKWQQQKVLKVPHHFRISQIPIDYESGQIVEQGFHEGYFSFGHICQCARSMLQNRLCRQSSSIITPKKIFYWISVLHWPFFCFGICPEVKALEIFFNYLMNFEWRWNHIFTVKLWIFNESEIPRTRIIAYKKNSFNCSKFIKL